MTSARTVLVSALAGVAITLTAFVSLPHGGARAEASPDPVDLRIASAFALLSDAAADPRVEAVAAQDRKGDLGGSTTCATEVWPAITANCLVADADAAARPVRQITLGYQDGGATTVLVRAPLAQVASR